MKPSSAALVAASSVRRVTAADFLHILCRHGMRSVHEHKVFPNRGTTVLQPKVQR